MHVSGLFARIIFSSLSIIGIPRYVAVNWMKVTSFTFIVISTGTWLHSVWQKCDIWCWWFDFDIYLRPVTHSFINDCCREIIPDIQTMPLVTEKNITSKNILATYEHSFWWSQQWEELGNKGLQQNEVYNTID